ncbi:E3 ubiquitin-protein ligase TRIM71-like [Magallana gigas]|uniref:E3 ubiquitin-protein ligase TRIM71-like n=1 Tax=Magallana gigas TaxID=29159 RepID=UPI00333EC39C
MSDSENSDSETAEEQYPEEEEEELYPDEDDFWDVSESDEEKDESSSDSDNKDSASTKPKVLHPTRSAQYAILCNLCSRSSVTSYCIPCCVSLCSNCVDKHTYNSSKPHKVVPYLEKYDATKYPECKEHAKKECQFYCEDCDIPLCHTCVPSDKHRGHKISDDLGKGKREKVKKDLKELKEKIFPFYQKLALDLQGEKTAVKKHYERLDAAVSKYGDTLLKKMKAVVEKEKSCIIEGKSKHISTLEKQEISIAKKMSKLERRILELNQMLDTSNEFIASEYESKNSKFNRMPSRKIIPLLKFVPNMINENDLHQNFGFLTFSAVTQDKDGFIMTNPSAHKPEIIKTVATGKKGCLSSVECCSNSEVWTTWGKIMKLHNLNGELLKSIKTKSGYNVGDITTTKKGYLVYSDPDSKTINRMKKKTIKEVITLHGWTPCSVCSTSLDGLLVIMTSNDKKQSKVIRYTDSFEESLTAQFDDNGVPLYSKSSNTKYVSENKNLDICVADMGSRSVVVVNQTGCLRFRYTGSPSAFKTSLKPDGIATDSHSQILTADSHNKRIHFLDQDGHFLRYIAVDKSDCPFSFCVDTNNTLFVAGKKSGEIKMITYT